MQLYDCLSAYYPDAQYSMLRDELEGDAQYLEADSWSVAVDQNYLRALDKQAVKRQDVIYGRCTASHTQSYIRDN